MLVIFMKCYKVIQVGGIQFDFLMEDEASRLENNQAKLKRLMKLSRGKRFNQWQHGEMRAIGSRLPAGGRLGDGYGPYPGVIVTSTADIETLFSHASVSSSDSLRFLVASEVTTGS